MGHVTALLLYSPPATVSQHPNLKRMATGNPTFAFGQKKRASRPSQRDTSKNELNAWFPLTFSKSRTSR